MKLAYQGPETDTPGDLRVYERPDGSIEEIRSKRASVVLFVSLEFYLRDSAKWEEAAKEAVTRQIEAEGDEPYGSYEVHVVDDGSYGIHVSDHTNRRVDDAVRIEARQKYWPAVQEGEA